MPHTASIRQSPRERPSFAILHEPCHGRTACGSSGAGLTPPASLYSTLTAVTIDAGALDAGRPSASRFLTCGPCLQAVKTLTQVSDDLKPLMLQDLRIQCRARRISPAGSRQTLLERLAEHMMATDN